MLKVFTIVVVVSLRFAIRVDLLNVIAPAGLRWGGPVTAWARIIITIVREIQLHSWWCGGCEHPLVHTSSLDWRAARGQVLRALPETQKLTHIRKKKSGIYLSLDGGGGGARREKSG